MKKRTSIPNIKDVIKRVVTGIEEQSKTFSDIETCWHQTVGEETATHARPRGMQKGTLWIDVDDSLHLFELKVDHERIAGNLKQQFPKIKKIKYRIR